MSYYCTLHLSLSSGSTELNTRLVGVLGASQKGRDLAITMGEDRLDGGWGKGFELYVRS